MSEKSSFFSELKRRNVYKVAVAYVVAKRRFVSSYALAEIQAMLGNKDEAVRLLEKAYDERSILIGGGGIGGPKIDNRFDSLSSDPRFEKFVAKFMGETQ